MKASNQIKVLIVEDDAEWRESLCRMYEEILPACHVDSASSGRDALRRIENGDRFNLLSLDINLGSTHPRTEAGHIPGADGRSVLRRAHEKHSCNGVIVITGLAYDETLIWVMTEEEIKKVRMTLHASLDGLFPKRNLYLQKISTGTPDECISQYKTVLDRKKLESLCAAIPGVPPPYTIDKQKDEILIKSRTKHDSYISVKHPRDRELIRLLCEMKKYPGKSWIEKETVSVIYRKADETKQSEKEDKSARNADSEINSLKRRLRKEEIDPDALLNSVRGIGWELCSQVHLGPGFSSVDKRSSGLGTKYGRDMVMDDLPDENSSDQFDVLEEDGFSDD